MGFDFYMVNSITILRNAVWIGNERMPDCPAKGRNIAIVKNKIYIDSYELTKDRKWKKTLRAWWYTRSKQ